MTRGDNSRLAETIRARVAQVVLFELGDPRIAFTTITRVKLARDLSTVHVYYSVFGTPGQRSATGHALEDARGHVQREMAKALHTRSVPHLTFVYDESVEGGLRMGELFKKIEGERPPAEKTPPSESPEASKDEEPEEPKDES